MHSIHVVVACSYIHFCMSFPVADDTIIQLIEVNILFVNHLLVVVVENGVVCLDSDSARIS